MAPARPRAGRSAEERYRAVRRHHDRLPTIDRDAWRQRSLNAAEAQSRHRLAIADPAGKSRKGRQHRARIGDLTLPRERGQRVIIALGFLIVKIIGQRGFDGARPDTGGRTNAVEGIRDLLRVGVEVLVGREILEAQRRHVDGDRCRQVDDVEATIRGEPHGRLRQAGELSRDRRAVLRRDDREPCADRRHIGVRAAGYATQHRHESTVEGPRFTGAGTMILL